jgi:flavodoxin I
LESEKASGLAFYGTGFRLDVKLPISLTFCPLLKLISDYASEGIRLKAIVVYLSTSGNTKAMAEAIAHGIESKNVDVKAVSFYDVKPEELNEAEAIAVGSSTFYYKMLPPMEKFMSETLASSNPKGKIGAAFGSYGWSGEAPIVIAEKMREMGMTVIDPVLRILHKPTDKDVQECKRLGVDIAEKLKHRKTV